MSTLNENEHKRIARFLKKEFLPFCTKYGCKFNIDPTNFLAVLKDSYQEDQEEIAEQYGTKINDQVSQSTISRAINEINEKLKVFCGDFIVDPPIQIFSYYIDPIDKKRKPFGCFLACAKALEDRRNCAEEIFSLKEAKMRGKLKARKVSQETEQEQIVPSSIQSKEIKREQSKQSPEPEYFWDMKRVLIWNNRSVIAEELYKDGPIAADFESGKIFRRESILNEIHGYTSKYPITILKGEAGSGKSVLVRQFAHDLIKSNPQLPIYYYSFKEGLKFSGFQVFINEIKELSGTLIIEDLHLTKENVLLWLERLSNNSNRNFLLTYRIAPRNNNHVKHEGESQSSLDMPPSLNAEVTENEIDEIIINYINNNDGEDFTFTIEHKNSIKRVSGKNLWLLSYALKGCCGKKGKGEPDVWIESGVRRDFENIETAKCNTDILLALSLLYKNEVLTAYTFLKDKLNFSREDIQKLLLRHEIIEVVDEEDQVYYGLPHSTLAKVYWKFKDNTRADFLEHLDVNHFESDEELSFIYNYATYRLKNGSGLANGLSAILKMDYPTRTLMLQRLDVDLKTINTVMSETNIESFFDWISSYGFYFSRNSSDNIWARIIIPKFFDGHEQKIHRFTHETIKEISFICGVSNDNEKLKKIIKELPEEESSGPNNICQILLILKYIDKEIMAEFWDSVDYRLFVNRLLLLDIYNICQNIILLLWVAKAYGEFIWDQIDKEELKARLNETKEDVSIPKAIGTFSVYLPDGIRSEFIEMFDIDHIISSISNLSKGFCRDYYIAMFSLFNLEYKERLCSILDIESFLKHIPRADLVELSICIKYLFDTHSRHRVKLYNKLNYEALTAKFYEEDYLDGVLRVIESIYTAYPAAGRELCRKLNLDKIGNKLKRNKLQYKTKEQFIEFVSYVDSSVGEKLLEKINI